MNIEYLNLCDFNHDIQGAGRLKAMTHEQLEDHFFNHRIAEGRIYSQVKCREESMDSVEFYAILKKG